MCVGFVGRIHKDETRGALRVIGREDTDIETCDRGPDEHHRSGNPASVEEFGQLACDAACCPRRWARIAVTHTCPVIRAHARKSSDVRLDKDPTSARATEACVEDHSRRAVPGAPQMQPVPSDVDELSGRRSNRQVLSSRKPFVRGTCERGHDDQATQTNENA
jgi:hypothetical protein